MWPKGLRISWPVFAFVDCDENRRKKVRRGFIGCRCCRFEAGDEGFWPKRDSTNRHRTSPTSNMLLSESIHRSHQLLEVSRTRRGLGLRPEEVGTKER